MGDRQKLLTISIAAYNVEEYIREGLDSIVNASRMDEMEVFVVDDGGTDGTLEIAREYEEKYPETFHAVHKENGGYGSTVNYSIEHATGKYFKLLDGDDWFDSKNLGRFVDMLREADADAWVTPFYQCFEGSDETKVDLVGDYIPKEKYDLRELTPKLKKTIWMWTLAYRTQILQSNNFQFPLHCLFTDQLYSIMPFSAYVKTVCLTDCPLYCYRLGRDGQSVSKESRLKHIDDKMRVDDILYDFYEEQKALGNENIDYILRCVASVSRGIPKVYLLTPISSETVKNIAAYDQMLKEKYPDIYEMAGNRDMGPIANMLSDLRDLDYGEGSVEVLKKNFPEDGIEVWY